MTILRQAARSLWSAKSFAAIAVATIALGIAANTAVFSVVHAVLLRPLPFPDADRIVTLTHMNPKRDMRDATMSFPAFVNFASREHVFARVSAYSYDSFNLTGAGVTPEQLPGVRVTSSFFDVLGVPMAAGRGFGPEDDKRGTPPVVVVARRFWSRRFGMRGDAIGATLTLNGIPHTVVGALAVDLPPPFADVDIWAPHIDEISAFTPPQIAAGLGYLWGIARLPPGVRIADVQAECDAIVQAYGRANRGNTDADPEAMLHIVPIRERSVGSARLPLLIVAAAVGLVLLIVCANVANLLLVRATARAHEAAVRTALGARRRDLLAWLAAETGILAVLGGALGTVAALWLIDLASFAARDLPRGTDIRVDVSVLGFSIAATLASALLFGLAPVLRTIRTAPVDALRAGSRSASAPPARATGVLVVVEVALSLALLVGAGLLLRSFTRVMRAPVGFRSEGLLGMTVSLPGAKYADASSMRAFLTNVVPALERVPGAASAGAAMSLPPFVNVVAPYLVADGPDVPLAQRPFAAWTGVSPGYFQAMGIPLVDGRAFTARDDERAPLVAVVNQTLARRAWPGQSPIGKRMLVGRFPGFAEVVGIAGDVKNAGLAQPPQAEVYTPYAQRPWPTMRLVVRAGGGDPRGLTASARAAVASVDHDLPITDVETLDASLADSVATTRVTAFTLAAFAIVALAIAATGLYGVIAQAVERRTREVGIRVALGADAGVVLRTVAADGIRLAVVGMIVGLTASAMIVRAARSLLVDVSPADPATYAAVVAVFTATAAAATIVPARRALRVDPIIALRAE